MRPPISPSRSCRAAPHDQPSPRLVSPSKRSVAVPRASTRACAPHSATVSAGHVAHRDVARAGAFEVDRVHAHADLLNEVSTSAPRRLRASTGSQAVPQHFRIAQQLEQASVFRLGAHRDVESRCRRMRTATRRTPAPPHSCRSPSLRQNFPEHVEGDAFEPPRFSIRIGLAEPSYSGEVVRFDDERSNRAFRRRRRAEALPARCRSASCAM